ncbi:invasion associated locus B family protein [Azorhizobium doebereinerae]|uniref:invasion associated locus B family protein n=1 Tax=Azorhizobium doebereinerae TaxID=281091 RepID=UPI0004273F5A|nr:invasion associated locus B family protein [Azorhizobium doebereinerae]
MTKATTLRRASALAAAAITLGAAGGAFAQTATPAKPAQAKPAQAQPAAPAQQPAQAQQQGAPQSVAVPGINTPWTKVCGTDQGTKKEICMTTQDFTAETGQPLASAAIREVKDDPNKKFIVSVPVGMLLQPGTRVIIDQQPPLSLKYEICFPNGCFAGMDVNAEFVTKLKKAQNITVQALQMGGRTLNFILPAKDFAKAYDGPPSDPNVVAAERQKLAEELQKRAQKMMEERGGAQPGATPAAGAPATPAAPAAPAAPAKP